MGKLGVAQIVKYLIGYVRERKTMEQRDSYFFSQRGIQKRI